MPFCLRSGVVTREHDAHAADRALRDEHLGAVEHPARRPSRTARVASPAASDPEPGSVSAHAPSHSPVASFGRYFCFCASFPNVRMCAVPSPLCDASVSASEPSARAISSTTIAYASVSSPAPPYSSGMRMPRRPSAPSFGTISFGKRSSSSHARACGATSLRRELARRVADRPMRLAELELHDAPMPPSASRSRGPTR